jgi:anti-anti-sigma factor
VVPDDGRVLYAERDDTCVLRFQGPIRYTMAPSVDAFLDELLATRAPRMICADLSEIESIDSTGIGLLAKIAIAQRRAGRGKPLLFSPRPDINEVLRSVCLDDVFQMVERTPEADPIATLTPGEPSEQELRRTILEAHRVLSELSESNRATFRDVVEGLAKDVLNEQAPASPKAPD